MNRMVFLPALLILSLIGCCVEIDLSVPSFPDMARYFATSEEVIQWTLSLNFFGFCISALLYGPLSEAWGRRKIMIWGASLFFIGGAGCVFAQSIQMLIACRFVQGLGASASACVAFAMIADVYKGDKATSYIGMMNSVLTAAMAAAPIAGGFINAHFGWRMNYTTVAVIGLISLVAMWVLLPETKVNKEQFSLRKLGTDYAMMLSSKKFMLYSLAPTALVSAYFAFVAVVSFLYVDQLGLSLTRYSIHQGAVVSMFSIISYFSGRICGWLGNARAIVVSMVMVMIGACAILVCAFVGTAVASLITVPMCICAAGIAISFAIIFAESLEIFPEARGAASSMIMSIRMLGMSSTIALVGHFYDGTLMPTAIAIAVLATIGAYLTVILPREDKVPAAV